MPGTGATSAGADSTGGSSPTVLAFSLERNVSRESWERTSTSGPLSIEAEKHEPLVRRGYKGPIQFLYRDEVEDLWNVSGMEKVGLTSSRFWDLYCLGRTTGFLESRESLGLSPLQADDAQKVDLAVVERRARIARQTRDPLEMAAIKATRKARQARAAMAAAGSGMASATSDMAAGRGMTVVGGMATATYSASTSALQSTWVGLLSSPRPRCSRHGCLRPRCSRHG